MSANTAELTLLIKAKNLVDVEISKVKTSLSGLADKAKTYATDMSDAFKKVGSRIASHLGNLATDILSGGSIETSMLSLGAILAGGAIEGMAAHFIPDMLAKVMSTAAFAPLAAAMAGGGATLGSILATAIAVGAAAFPFILLALAVAALIYVATNPEFRDKAKQVALDILGKIGEGLKTLAVFLADKFKKGVEAARLAVSEKIGEVIQFFKDIPDKIHHVLFVTLPRVFALAMNAVKRKVADVVDTIVGVIKGIIQAVKDALAWLNILATNGNKGNEGTSQYPKRHNAAGGWVGLHGPELSWLGEKGPEYVIPNHQLGSMGTGGGGKPVVIQLVLDGREVGKVVDERLYYAIQRAAPTAGRA